MAKDKYHYFLKEALEKDGWTITHDSYFLMLGKRRGFDEKTKTILEWKG